MNGKVKAGAGATVEVRFADEVWHRGTLVERVVGTEPTRRIVQFDDGDPPSGNIPGTSLSVQAQPWCELLGLEDAEVHLVSASSPVSMEVEEVNTAEGTELSDLEARLIGMYVPCMRVIHVGGGNWTVTERGFDFVE